MLTPLVAKIAVTTILGFSTGFYGSAVAALGGTQPVSANAGAFGGPVAHVGAIEWDVAQPAASALRHVRCAPRAHAGTSCFLDG